MYDFENVEEMARENPDTFRILPREVRETLEVGDYAKLLFVFSPSSEENPGGERMWVSVTARSSDGSTYMGLLSNIPTIAPNLKMGDLVYFKPEHICQIMRKGESVVSDADDGEVGGTHKSCNDPQWR